MCCSSSHRTVLQGRRKWKELSPIVIRSPERSLTALPEGVCSVPFTVTPFLPSTSSSHQPVAQYNESGTHTAVCAATYAKSQQHMGRTVVEVVGNAGMLPGNIHVVSCTRCQKLRSTKYDKPQASRAAKPGPSSASSTVNSPMFSPSKVILACRPSALT